MKSGLLSILACPICKNYPLKLNIYKWETEKDKFDQIKNNIDGKSIRKIKNEVNVKISKSKDDIKIRDTIVREEKDFNTYIKNLNNIYDDLLSIKDLSNTDSDKILDIIKNELFEKIKGHKDLDKLEHQLKLLDQIEIYILLANWYLFSTEIEEGIMYCNKCKRWYPIIDTIPQMLPDEVRNEKSELLFLQKWKELIDEEIFLEGKPFNLKNK